MKHALAVLAATLAPFTATAGDNLIKIVDMAAMELAANPAIDGVEAAMLWGAFDAPGMFAANAVMRDGSLFPPHSHDETRVSLVLSGTMYIGTGDTVDETAEQVVPAGSIALTPAGTPHWMAARGGDVRIIEIGTGPDGTTFVNE